MASSQHVPIDQMDFFQAFQAFADWSWDQVESMAAIHLWTFGKQLVSAADATCANLIEGGGRYTDPDKLHFFVIARASAQESLYWLRRAARQKAIDKDQARQKAVEVITACKQLNKFISYRRANPWKVKEVEQTYDVDYRIDWPD